MTDCPYTIDVNDESTVGCDLQADHKEWHRFLLEWEHTPSDECGVSGHNWGAWGKYKEPHLGFYDLAGRQYKEGKEPTKQRTCKRCDRIDRDGELEFWGLFPSIPFRNRLSQRQ